MPSLVSREALSVIASFTLTMLIGATAMWCFSQSGHFVPLNVLMWTLFPTTFFVPSTALEYLEDGNIGRSLVASLFNTGFVGLLIVALYLVAVFASPRSRLARYHHRPSLSIERTALRIPMGRVWESQEA